MESGQKIGFFEGVFHRFRIFFACFQVLAVSSPATGRTPPPLDLLGVPASTFFFLKPQVFFQPFGWTPPPPRFLKKFSEREALRRQLARLQGMMDSCLAESRRPAGCFAVGAGFVPPPLFLSCPCLSLVRGLLFWQLCVGGQALVGHRSPGKCIT